MRSGRHNRKLGSPRRPADIVRLSENGPDQIGIRRGACVSATNPDPTARPPWRIANWLPDSIGIGLWRELHRGQGVPLSVILIKTQVSERTNARESPRY